jgi:UPF0176 protein
MYINISGYKFIELTNLEEIKAKLKPFCIDLGLKGTVLLANEGANIFVSGTKDCIDIFTRSLPDFGLPSITFKESPSEAQPFKRMLVKIKAEIIAMGQPQIKPELHPAPYLDVKTFAKWIKEKKDMVVLDTRNDYEIHLGKFKDAIDLNVHNFNDFPEAVDNMSEEFKSKPVVTYCTGGIRCEKAAPYMIQAGFKEVYQLDGGILKYFEECGNEGWEGECFVFDKRVGVNTDLNETSTIQCFACRKPLLESEAKSEHYKLGESCHNCI